MRDVQTLQAASQMVAKEMRERLFGAPIQYGHEMLLEGGGSFGAPIIVRVELAGGSAGGPSSPCTFTYNIYSDLDDWASFSSLADDLTPEEQPRPSAGAYVAAPDGSRGLAYQFGGEWVLLVAFRETFQVGPC